MNHQPLPLIDIPLNLSDEAAAKLIDFLLQIAHQLENHYSEQLYRYPTTESMSDKLTCGQTPTRRSESSPALGTATGPHQCPPFMRTSTQQLTHGRTTRRMRLASK